MVWVLKLVVHVEKFNGLFWGSNDSVSSSVQVFETLFFKVDEAHVASNTGSFRDSSNNAFAVLIVALLVGSTPDSSGKIGGSSDTLSEAS